MISEDALRALAERVALMDQRIAQLERVELKVDSISVTDAVSAPTASRVLRRDASGRGSLAQINLARSDGSAALFGIDFTQYGSEINLVNNAIAKPFTNSPNFSGIILCQCSTAGAAHGAMFWTGGGQVIKICDTGPIYSTVSGTASKFNVYLDGSNVVNIENKFGITVNIGVGAIRVRPSA